MRTKIVLWLVTLQILATSAFATGEKFAPPLIVIPKLPGMQSAAIERAVWKLPATVPGFVKYEGKGLPQQQTEVRVAYDDKNLYFAFRCREPKMAELVTDYQGRDNMVWRDDSVSILLSPGSDPKHYINLSASVAGVQFDEKGQDGKSWNGAWTVKTDKAADNWTAFITIPFADLDTTCPKPGTVWKGNMSRHAKPLEELTHWSTASGGFQEPEWWGSIRFAGEKDPVVNVAADGSEVPGLHHAIVYTSNPTPRDLHFVLQPYSGTKPLDGVKLDVPPGSRSLSIPYRMPFEGRLQFSLAVLDSAGKPVYRTGAFLMHVPDNKTRLLRYTKLLGDHNPPNAEVAAQKEAALKELKRLLRLADSAMGNAAKWAELTPKVDEVSLTVARVRYLCADKSAANYALGTTDCMTKVMPGRLFEGTFGQPAQISACRNEFESTQVVVCATKPLNGVHVSASSLVGPNGASIPADRVQINIVDFVKTGKPRYETDYIGWYPDPLLENRPFDVDAVATQPVWVTVHVPTGIPAGLYKGQLTVKPGNASETTLPLEVTVWDFDLPTQQTFKTAFALFPHELGAWWHDMTDDKRRAQYQFLLDHRISPTNIYTSSPLPEKPDIPFCVERGMNSMCLVYTHNKDEKNRLILADKVREYETYLKEHGWWDKAYLYGFDEINPDKYSELIDMYGWVKKTFPDLPRMCTVIPNQQLKGYVDIWVPVTSNYRQDVAEQYVKDGDQVWWYVCVNPGRPYPNFFIDESGVNPRVIFWQCWKYRIPGFLYYAINLWENNRKLRGHENDAHPLKDWVSLTGDGANGDGILVYPGPDGRLLSSMRFEAIRDGIEDWECLNILEQEANLAEYGVRDTKKVHEMKNFKPRNLAEVAEARKLLKIRSEIVSNMTEYTQDPAVLLAERAKVANLIVKLKRQ
jgi:hypothetical protein